MYFTTKANVLSQCSVINQNMVQVKQKVPESKLDVLKNQFMATTETSSSSLSEFTSLNPHPIIFIYF